MVGAILTACQKRFKIRTINLLSKSLFFFIWNLELFIFKSFHFLVVTLFNNTHPEIKKVQKYIIIDFDSTFTKVEGLEELANISLNYLENKEEIIESIKKITDSSMEGRSSLADALNERIALIQANRKHLPLLIERLMDKISDSFIRNKDFFEKFSDNILIVSSGFKEFIVPIVTEFGILEENVYANTFDYDSDGNIINCNPDNLLAKDKGKVEQLKSLNLQGDVYVIGDGYTDYEIREAGLANKFYAFTENIERNSVSEKADHIAPSLEEFLYDNKLPMAISYPKNRIQVLVLENIHQQAIDIFKNEGYQIEVVAGSLDEEELCQKIQNVSILCIRSKTEVTAKVLSNANKLIAIGAFCIGTNQIDLNAAMEKGVAVFNAPYSNTRSVAELAIGQMILLMRNTIPVSNAMHAGIWNKSAKNSNEIRGKKLGIIGYGNIGSQLSILAESMGMEVYFYDVVDKLSIGNAKKCSTLKELLEISDVVSLHVDGRKSNHKLIDKKEFEMMKQGVIFLNLSRGSVVCIDHLKEYILNEKIRGASVDVFPVEPKKNQDVFDSILCNVPNLILTPHIGGSTAEAQENIASYVPNKIINYINIGDTFGSVNLPNIQLSEQKEFHRLIHIHHNRGGVLAKINHVLAENGANILGQYLKTNEKLGFVITDIDKQYEKEIIQEMKNIPETIKFRILY